MADNVNIIVQDKINDIVVNAAVVVETIDINVQAAVDVVDIVANPNNYVVNINRIIGEQVQSDWTQTDNQAPDYIKNKPTIPAAQVNSDWDATSGVAEILNKPTIPTATSDLTNDGEDGINPFITAADIPPVEGFVPYTGATEDVNLGNNDLYVNEIFLYDGPNDNYGSVHYTDGNFHIEDGDGHPLLVIEDEFVQLHKNATIQSNLWTSGLTATRDHYLPNQSGTIALTSDIPSVTGFVPYTGATQDVNLGTHDLTATQGTFATSGNPDTLTVNHSSGSGKALTITKGGAGEGIYVNKTSGSGNAVTIVGDLEATNLKRTGGTSSQFLKADGSVDSNTYFQLPGLTSGSVLFSNGTTIAQDNANLFWDDTNNRLGIGTASPTAKLHIIGDVYTSTGYIAAGNSYMNSIGNTSTNNNANLSLTASGVRTSRNIADSNTVFAITNQNASSTGAIQTWNNSAGELMRVTQNGNVLINTTTDAGYKLDVNGTARVSGNATFGTGFFWDNTNNRLGIGTNAPAETLEISSTGATGFAIKRNATSNAARFFLKTSGTYNWSIGIRATRNDFSIFNETSVEALTINATTNNVLINTTTDAGYKLDVNGTARVQNDFSISSGFAIASLGNNLNLRSNLVGGSGYVVSVQSYNALNSANNEQGFGEFKGMYAPTSVSGTPSFNALKLTPTINQTGTATGITRGLFINPTLTAAADFRAIEVANGITILGASTTAKASLRIPSGTAPTTPTNGDIWFDGTDLKMRIGGVTKTFTLI